MLGFQRLQKQRQAGAITNPDDHHYYYRKEYDDIKFSYLSKY